MAASGARSSVGYDAIVGLGSNLGDKRANLARALELLCAGRDVAVVRRSRDFASPPWGDTAQDWFVNCAAAVATRLSAPELLARCLAVEEAMGRVRERRWGPRIVDLDVLFYPGVITDDPVLTLPHPRISERAFVLGPLMDIDPTLEIQGRSVAEWRARLPADAATPLA